MTMHTIVQVSMLTIDFTRLVIYALTPSINCPYHPSSIYYHGWKAVHYHAVLL